MKKIFALLFFCILAIMPVAAKEAKQQAQATQLEIRQMQTREYDSVDKALIMKAMLNVLQDEGYVVYTANPLLGCIYSVKEFDNTSLTKQVTEELGLPKYGGIGIMVVDSNANVTEYGKKIRVRMTFKMKILNSYGSVAKVINVSAPSYYQTFFSKVDKAIYLQKQKI